MPKNRKKQRENRRLYKSGVSSKNAEGYTDLTASTAINSVIKESIQSNRRCCNAEKS